MLFDLEKILPMFEALVKELKKLKKLNENLSDSKIMVTPYLGWRVVKDKKNRQKGERR